MGTDIMGWARYQYCRLRQYPHYRKEIRQAEARRKGASFPEFEKLRALRGTEAGNRCFVIGNGAGLTEAETAALRTQKTFGVGAFLEQDLFVPRCICIQNPAQLKRLKSGLLSSAAVFAGDNLAGQSGLPDDAVLYSYLGVYKYYLNQYGENRTKFSGDAYAVVYDGGHAAYSMMQIAVYLGFAEICLIGCGPADDDRLDAAYRTAKAYADAHGIRIFDSTAGVSGGVFPHRELRELL